MTTLYVVVMEIEPDRLSPQGTVETSVFQSEEAIQRAADERVLPPGEHTIWVGECREVKGRCLGPTEWTKRRKKLKV